MRFPDQELVRPVCITEIMSRYDGLVLSRELRNAQERVERDYPSHCRYRGIPLLDRLGSEGAQRAAGDEMALQVEGVVDGGMGGEKALSGSG